MTHIVPINNIVCGVVVALCSGLIILEMGFINSFRFSSLRLAKYLSRSNLKLRTSCTQKFLSSDIFWMKTVVSGRSICKAFANATLPVAVLLVSSFEITRDNSGAWKCLMRASFSAVSIIACSFTICVQSLSPIRNASSPIVARIHANVSPISCESFGVKPSEFDSSAAAISLRD